MDVGMAAPTRIGTEVAGFRIESMLGRGGMSVVYVAEQTRLGRKVALKVLTTELAWDETFRERFVRESHIAATIDHRTSSRSTTPARPTACCTSRCASCKGPISRRS